MRKKKVVIELTGGLGNQLFLLFDALIFAQKNNRVLVISKALFGLGKGVVDNSLECVTIGEFNWEEQEFEKLCFSKIRRVLVQVSWHIKLASFFERKILSTLYNQPEFEKIKKRSKITLRRFNQTYRNYFEFLNMRPLEINLKDRFTSEKFTTLLIEITKVRPLIVHIRGGDYRELSSTYGLLSSDYFDNAIKKAKTGMNPTTPIWVFTDDVNYAEGIIFNLKLNAKIVDIDPALKAIHYLLLMREGSGHILSNSTFAWWGAILSVSSTCVIAPTPWYRNLNVLPPEHPFSWFTIESTWRDDI